MHLFATLLLAHLFADFPLQTNGLAKLKKERLVGVFLHVLVYVAITTMVLHEPLHNWPLIVGLGIVHFFIDALKAHCPPKLETFYFVIDQALHLLSIAIATYLTLYWWATPPQSSLSYTLVCVALGFALILAGMVFCWVWVNNLSEEQVQQHFLLCWIKWQLLGLAQRIGLVLLCVVFAAPAYQWLTSIFHLGNR